MVLALRLHEHGRQDRHPAKPEKMVGAAGIEPATPPV
jgi:hypothetical protein